MPSDTEFAAMSDYLAVMKPLVQITEALGGGNGLQSQWYVLRYISYSMFTYKVHLLTQF